MDLITKDDIKKLAEKNDNLRISLYMPTHRLWNKMDEDLIRYKNLLNKIEKKLIERKYRTQEITDLLNTPRNLLDDKQFWNHQSDGLALFFDKDSFNYYRLPLHFKENITLHNRYYIKPLLPMLSGDGRFFLLALDQNEIKLYQGSRFSLSRLALPQGTMLSLKEMLQYEEFEKSLQFRTGTQSSGSHGVKISVFHGHGGRTIDDAVHKEKILEFFHLVDKGVFKVIHDENSPLILAGVEYLLPLYRKTNDYPYLLDEALDLNPEDLTDSELHLKAWKIVETVFNRNQLKARAMYEQFSGNGRATSSIGDIIKASIEKKIEYLFVNVNEQRWGIFDIDKNEIRFTDRNEPGAEDLLDFASVNTMIGNGTVYAVEKEKMPCDKPLAAVFRY
jgi:hypothetical protein